MNGMKKIKMNNMMNGNPSGWPQYICILWSFILTRVYRLYDMNHIELMVNTRSKARINCNNAVIQMLWYHDVRLDDTSEIRKRTR